RQPSRRDHRRRPRLSGAVPARADRRARIPGRVRRAGGVDYPVSAGGTCRSPRVTLCEARDMTGALLAASGLTKHFGGLTAVEGLELELLPGEILALIGPNGAGKTTTFNLIVGVFPPSAGSITLDGVRIDGMPVHRIAALGLMRTFQHNMPFAGMPLADNILVGRHTHFRAGLVDILLGLRRFREEEAGARRRAAELATLVGLGDEV